MQLRFENVSRSYAPRWSPVGQVIEWNVKSPRRHVNANNSLCMHIFSPAVLSILPLVLVDFIRQQAIRYLKFHEDVKDVPIVPIPGVF